MNESCTDCVHIKNLGKEVEINRIKLEKLETEMNTVKFEVGINKEQTKMVFNILNEIKGSIEKIATKIDEIETRPSKLLYSVAGGTIVAIIMLAINLLTKN